MTEVVSYLPSEALAEVQKDSSLRRLILTGYDLKEEAKSDPVQAASVEFDYPDDRAVVFVAKDNGEDIGSLTLIKWKYDEKDKRGSKFWPKLLELSPEIGSRALGYNPLACDVGGVVSNPTQRREGIGRLLYQKAIEELNPSILVGQTKTVGAVMLRSKLEAFRTFYGETEVTASHPQSKTTDQSTLAKAFLYARDIDELLPEGMVYVYHGGIAPTIPSTVGYPSIIQEAFVPVIHAQRRLLANGETVMAPHISVRNEVLPK